MKFWNGRVSGLFGSFFQGAKAAKDNLLDNISTFLHTNNFGACGKGTQIQKGIVYRNPSNISLGSNINIGRFVELSTELPSATLEIGDNTVIGKNSYIDFTGCVSIGKNCTFSQEIMIQSHDHGLNPRDTPIQKALKIEDNVWVGTKVIILQNVHSIGENSIVAASSVVTKDVPKNVIVAGNPARVIKELTIKA